MRVLFILFILIFVGYFAGTKYYEKSLIEDLNEYHKVYDEYFKPIEGIDYPDFTLDYYAWWVRNYETIKDYTYPKTQKEYLKDKLRYYDEITFKHKSYIHFLIQDAEQAFQTVSEDEPSLTNEFFEKNRQMYIRITQERLKSAEKIAHFNEYELIRDRKIVVSNGYYNKFKEIVKESQLLRKSQNEVPSMLFILDGGNGKDVPLDDYESTIFLKLIQKSIEDKKEKRISQLYQSMIAFQIEEQDFYFNTAYETLDNYVKFLKSSQLNFESELRSLIELIKSLKRVDSYKDDIQAQEECIKRINSMLQI